jgi:hypothetical protein
LGHLVSYAPLMSSKSSLIAVAILLFARTVGGQAAVLSSAPTPTGIAVGLLRTAGPGFDSASSHHFLVYAERGERPRYDIRALIDSLETAWREGLAILESPVPDLPRITVLVTRSRHRFSPTMSPTNKGIAIAAESDGETILLVHNDSVRLYARHEVMHTLSRRAWGASQHWWVMEGIAVVADGRCLGSTSMALARDLLRAKPELTAGVFAKSFSALVREDLASAYGLAGSLVSFLLARGGVPLVRQTWTVGADLIDLPATSDLTRTDWRTYVESATVGQPSIHPDSLARFGCG